MMIRLALLLTLMLVMAGCASFPSHSYHAARERAACPAGTTMVCEVDTLRGCGCGRLIF